MSKKADAEELKISPYLGADEDDDIDQMAYPEENVTPLENTHPPETKAEAEELAALAEKEESDDESEDTEEAANDEESEDTEEAADDEESEDTEEAADDEESEDTEEEVDPTKGQKVPYERFKEVNDKAKAAEAHAAELEARISKLEKSEPEPTPKFDFATKEKAAMAKMLDGDEDGYIALREEIREAEKAEYIAKADELAENKTSTLQRQMSFQDTAVALEKEFPAIDETNADFNAEARDEVLDLYTGYVNSGKYGQAAALEHATRKVAKLYAWNNDEAGDPEEPPEVTKTKKTDVKAKAKADKAQAPTIKSRARDSNEPTLDISSMSDEEFEALPNATKARLRGDVV